MVEEASAMGAWKPGKVVLCGWCADFNLRAEQGISESVARRVLAALKENDGKFTAQQYVAQK